jgi:hypothetical protein
MVSQARIVSLPHVKVEVAVEAAIRYTAATQPAAAFPVVRRGWVARSENVIRKAGCLYISAN